MDNPLGYSEEDEGMKLPQSPGTTKPQTPILHMVLSLLKEHNSHHPKGTDHQQQRTLLTHRTCSDIYFSTQGQQSESDKPTTLFFYATKTWFSWSCLPCLNNKEGICFVIPSPINQLGIWFTQTGKRGSRAHWRVVKTSPANFTFLHSDLQTKLSSRLTCHLQQPAPAIKHRQSFAVLGNKDKRGRDFYSVKLP